MDVCTGYSWLPTLKSVDFSTACACGWLHKLSNALSSSVTDTDTDDHDYTSVIYIYIFFFFGLPRQCMCTVESYIHVVAWNWPCSIIIIIGLDLVPKLQAPQIK